jgi:hypothetical protein
LKILHSWSAGETGAGLDQGLGWDVRPNAHKTVNPTKKHRLS